jgi:hypothetical protein
VSLQQGSLRRAPSAYPAIPKTELTEAHYHSLITSRVVGQVIRIELISCHRLQLRLLAFVIWIARFCRRRGITAQVKASPSSGCFTPFNSSSLLKVARPLPLARLLEGAAQNRPFEAWLYL